MKLEFILRKITTTVLESENNRLEGRTRFYDPPLVGAAKADDPIFEEMKKNEEIIGRFYKTPEEWLPGAVTVVSYFLPFSEPIRVSNYSPGLASEDWLHARIRGEEFNCQIRRLLVEEMEAAGKKAVAPMLEEAFEAYYTESVISSNWSERHAAFAAGLGTFSLNRGLITEKGMAGRFGSIITDIELEPTFRNFSSPFQFCPWISNGACGACIERCPAGAISENGKDKFVCYKYLLNEPQQELMERFGYPISSCGKCQTNVPCETCIP